MNNENEKTKTCGFLKPTHETNLTELLPKNSKINDNKIRIFRQRRAEVQMCHAELKG